VTLTGVILLIYDDYVKKTTSFYLLRTKITASIDAFMLELLKKAEVIGRRRYRMRATFLYFIVRKVSPPLGVEDGGPLSNTTCLGSRGVSSPNKTSIRSAFFAQTKNRLTDTSRYGIIGRNSPYYAALKVVCTKILSLLSCKLPCYVYCVGLGRVT